MPLTIFSSGALRVVVPRAVRINLFVRFIIPCRFPAWAVLTLPVAVTLNRFLQLDLVFILGIWFSLGNVNTSLGMPLAAPAVPTYLQLVVCASPIFNILDLNINESRHLIAHCGFYSGSIE